MGMMGSAFRGWIDREHPTISSSKGTTDARRAAAIRRRTGNKRAPQGAGNELGRGGEAPAGGGKEPERANRGRFEGRGQTPPKKGARFRWAEEATSVTKAAQAGIALEMHPCLTAWAASPRGQRPTSAAARGRRASTR